MFTGIIEECGILQHIGSGGLTIEAAMVLSDVHIGDSICVNGVCLTVTTFSTRQFTADVMPETLRRTSLGKLHPGSPVNLERALQVGARLGGHIVTGHIDGIGEVVSMKREDNAILLQIAAPHSILKGIVEKGSVTLDGISLTVAAVTDTDFTVSLIPHTVDVTNLRTKKKGSYINIETDILGKYVEKMLSVKDVSEGIDNVITKEFLMQNGF